MPAAIPLIIAAASSVATAKIASNGAKKAAATQAASAEKAAALTQSSTDKSLAFAEKMWSGNQGNLTPYMNLGSGASTTLGRLMGTSSPGQGGGMSLGSVGPQAGGGMVMLQGPDGSVSQKPAAELQHWLSKGATVVGAGGGGSSYTGMGGGVEGGAGRLGGGSGYGGRPQMRMM